MIQQQSNSFIKLYIFIAIIYVYFMNNNKLKLFIINTLNMIHIFVKIKKYYEKIISINLLYNSVI